MHLFILSESFSTAQIFLYHLQTKSLMKDSLGSVWERGLYSCRIQTSTIFCM